MDGYTCVIDVDGLRETTPPSRTRPTSYHTACHVVLKFHQTTPIVLLVENNVFEENNILSFVTWISLASYCKYYF